MTEAELAALEARHGGQVGEPYAITKIDPLTGAPMRDPNNQPLILGYRYTYQDGTYIILMPHASTGSDANAPTYPTYDVINGGTALKQATPKASAAPKLYKDPTTGQVYQWDPNAGWIDAKGLPVDKSIAAKADAAQRALDISQQNADTRSQAEKDAAAARDRALGISQQDADTRAATQVGRDRASARRAQENRDKQTGMDMYHNRVAQIQEDAVAGKITIAEAKDRITQAHQEVTEWLTQRQQDLSFAEGMARDSVSAMDSALNHMVPTATLAGLNQAQGQISKQAGLPFTPEQPTPFPWDPTSIPSQIALRALAAISPAAAAAAGQNPRGGPSRIQTAPVATSSSFVAPAFSMGGMVPLPRSTFQGPPLGGAATR
jgi:hypothetical protein